MEVHHDLSLGRPSHPGLLFLVPNREADRKGYNTLCPSTEITYTIHTIVKAIKLFKQDN
jgi:hypothetical protein